MADERRDDSILYQHSILWRGEDPATRKFKPALDNSTKVVRYFPGKAPRWAKDGDADEEDDGDLLKGRDSKRGSDRDSRRRSDRDTKKDRRLVTTEDAAISRLKRLAQTSNDASDRQTQIRNRRQMHEAQVLEAQVLESAEDEVPRKDEISKKLPGRQRNAEEAQVLKSGDIKEEVDDEDKVDDVKSEDDDDDEQGFDRRRQRAREIALMKRKEEEDKLKHEEHLKVEEEDEDDEEDSEDSDSDDDDDDRHTMLKPVFVSKANRDTVREKEQQAEEEKQLEKKRQAQLDQRKVDSKQQLVDAVTKDEQAERDGYNENDASDVEMPDDDDEKNEAEEYDLWKIRELKRVKRNREEREKRAKELAWILKRRAMTEEEREADDRRLDAMQPKNEKGDNFLFMQKYFHKGGFFMDKAQDGSEPIYLRNFHEPLEEEKYDKNLLPKAMQLRRGQFGKMGQVKHVHLSEADTTDFQAPWALRDANVSKYQGRMATASGVESFDRPGARGSKKG